VTRKSRYRGGASAGFAPGMRRTLGCMYFGMSQSQARTPVHHSLEYLNTVYVYKPEYFVCMKKNSVYRAGVSSPILTVPPPFPCCPSTGVTA